MLQTQIGAIWIGTKVAERIKEAVHSGHSRNIFTRITKDKVSNVSMFGIKSVLLVLSIKKSFICCCCCTV